MTLCCVVLCCVVTLCCVVLCCVVLCCVVLCCVVLNCRGRYCAHLVLCTDLHCVHNSVCTSPSAEDASLTAVCASSILQVWRMEGFDDNGCRCKLLDGHQVLHLATAASICFLQSTALPASDLVQTHVGLNKEFFSESDSMDDLKAS